MHSGIRVNTHQQGEPCLDNCFAKPSLGLIPLGEKSDPSPTWQWQPTKDAPGRECDGDRFEEMVVVRVLQISS
jgi:hypothetical protein